MTRNNKRPFSSLGPEEVKNLFHRLKTDEKFCRSFFFGGENEAFSMYQIRKYITGCVISTYKYHISKEDFGTIMYEKFWDDGTWHVLDTFSGKSLDNWLFTVTFHTITGYLKEQRIIKDVRQRTANNTKVMLKKQTPEGCKMIIDEVMPKGEDRDLLIKIYVERENEDLIMKAMKMDSNEFKKVKEMAEHYFKFRLVNSNYVYEEYVITDKSPRCITTSVDLEDAMGMFVQTDNIFSDVFGVNLANGEVEARAMDFISNFVTNILQWNERDIFIFTERRKGTKPTDVAKALGCRRDYVDTRYSRLNAIFDEKFRLWWYSHT